MNQDLAPTYQCQFGEFWLLWYSKSNNYSIVEHEFKLLLDHYLNVSSIDTFNSLITEEDIISDTAEIVKSLELYLENCNATNKAYTAPKLKFNSSKNHIQAYYHFRDKTIEINYDSELVKNIIHPAVAYLEVSKKAKAQTVFDIYLDEDLLCLFKDKELVTTVPKRDYHLLQGKFVMQLLSIVHDKQESDWLGTFHGSTISDGKNSIVFIGQSGKGKSTLCAILSSHGFELVADDVSPVLSKNGHIYYNPSAISIKEGAFNTLKPIVDDFDTIPTVLFNKTKGHLKYIPRDIPTLYSYPCKAIIKVNYNKGADTTLEDLTIKELLETLIPDSWISAEPRHAKQFLDWLKSIYFYKLTYSDTESVIKKITTVFKSF